MRRNFDISVFGLGEVCQADIEAIIDGVGDPNLRVAHTPERTGKLLFDTASIYDHTRLAFMDAQSFEEGFGGKIRLKIGTMVRFALPNHKPTLNVVVSHWLSRLTASEFSSKRHALGIYLRQWLEAFKGNNPEEKYIVLMGDYNDEPFSQPLAEQLFATRDRELARRESRFFYNPFWRHLGESLHSKVVGESESVCGTYFYGSGECTQWYTFDQMIFSSEFLRDGPLALSEELTMIIDTPELKRRLKVGRESFDHLPVLSTILLRNQT